MQHNASSAFVSDPSSNRAGGFPAHGFPSSIHTLGLWLSCSRPCRAARQAPESVSFLELVLGVVLVQSAAAAMFAPQPAPQPVAGPVAHFPEHSRAVTVMEVAAPASHHGIHFPDRFGDGSPLRAVVEDAAALVPEGLRALARGFHMRIRSPISAAAHFDSEPEKADAFLREVHRAGLPGVELQSPAFQPSRDLLPGLGAPPRRAEHDEVIGIADHSMAWALASIDAVIQGAQVDIRQKRRNHPALRRPLSVRRDLPFALPAFPPRWVRAAIP